MWGLFEDHKRKVLERACDTAIAKADQVIASLVAYKRHPRLHTPSGGLTLNEPDAFRQVLRKVRTWRRRLQPEDLWAKDGEVKAKGHLCYVRVVYAIDGDVSKPYVVEVELRRERLTDEFEAQVALAFKPGSASSQYCVARVQGEHPTLTHREGFPY
jgi:hypothetical protein